MDLTIEDFLDAGFKRFPAHNKSAFCLLEKRYEDDFYVHVYVYNMGEITKGHKTGLKFEMDNQYKDSQGNTFNVQLLNVQSPQHAIEFAQKIRKALCVRDHV